MNFTIYVPGSSADRLLPVQAVAAGEGRFRLEGPVPAESPFRTGEIVECEYRPVGAGRELVATVSVSRDSEYRSQKRIFAVCGFIVGFLLGLAFTLQPLGRMPVVLGVSLCSAAVFAWASVRFGDAAWRGIARMFDGF